MDIIDIGAAIALTGGAATAAQQAAAEANEKAGLADTAAQAATAAAEAANTAAAAYGTLAVEAETDRAAMNWWHMDTQAQLRDARNRVEELEEMTTAVLARAESIAPVQGGTASTNIASGELLMQGGVLYKATQAIVAGAAITPGTNVTAAKVANLLALSAGTITYTTNGYVNNSLASSSWVKYYPFGLAFIRLFVPITSALPTDGSKVATGIVSPAPAYAVYIPTACNSADGLGQIEVEITTAGVINVYTRGISKPSSGWGSYNVLVPYICNPV